MPFSRIRQLSFAEHLRATRQAKGLTQAELGRLMDLPDDVGQTRISRYEQGKHFPDPPAAAKLAKALGVPLAYLWASDDRQAEIILGFAQLNTEQQDGLLGLLREFLSERDSGDAADEDDT